MDGFETHFLAGCHVPGSIIDHQAVLRAEMNSIHQQPVYGRIGLDQFDLSGNNDFFEQAEELIFVPDEAELGMIPVCQPIKPVSSFFKPPQQFHGLRDDTRDGFLPVDIIRPNDVSVLGKLSGEIVDRLLEWVAFILPEVPVGEAYLAHEILHGLLTFRKELSKYPARVPVDDHSAEIEDYGLYR